MEISVGTPQAVSYRAAVRNPGKTGAEAFPDGLRLSGEPPGPPGDKPKTSRRTSEGALPTKPNAKGEKQDLSQSETEENGRGLLSDAPSEDASKPTDTQVAAASLLAALVPQIAPEAPDQLNDSSVVTPMNLAQGNTPQVSGSDKQTPLISGSLNQPYPDSERSSLNIDQTGSPPESSPTGRPKQFRIPGESRTPTSNGKEADKAIPDDPQSGTNASSTDAAHVRLAPQLKPGSFFADSSARSQALGSFDPAVIAELGVHEVETSSRPKDAQSAPAAIQSTEAESLAKGLGAVIPREASTPSPDAGNSTDQETVANSETNQEPSGTGVEKSVQAQARNEAIQPRSEVSVAASIPKAAKPQSAVIEKSVLDGVETAVVEFEEHKPTEKSEGSPVSPDATHTSHESVPSGKIQHGQFTADQAKPVSTDRTAETVKQIADHVERMVASGQSGKVTIHLRPAELGSVTVTVKTSGQKVDAEVAATHDGLAAALSENRRELSRAIEARGLSLGSVLVGQDGQTPGQHRGQQTLARSDFQQISNLRNPVSETSHMTVTTSETRWRGPGMDFIA